MTLDDYRHFYADEIRVVANLHDANLVHALATVPRESYLGPPPWKICSSDQAVLISLGMTSELYTSTTNPADLYHNALVAIDPARFLNNGHPSTLARWISELDLTAGGRVYHAGCGVGYFTALLAELVGPRGRVVAIDVDADLASRARQNLSGYPQVRVRAGDGAALDPGPSDAMLINAGITHMPPLWFERLNLGGSIVFPLTTKASEFHGNGVMLKITRKPSGLAARLLSFVSIFSFSSLRDPKIDPLISAALAQRTLLKLQSCLLNTHKQTDSCLLHTSQFCFSSAPLP